MEPLLDPKDIFELEQALLRMLKSNGRYTSLDRYDLKSVIGLLVQALEHLRDLRAAEHAAGDQSRQQAAYFGPKKVLRPYG